MKKIEVEPKPCIKEQPNNSKNPNKNGKSEKTSFGQVYKIFVNTHYHLSKCI